MQQVHAIAKFTSARIQIPLTGVKASYKVGLKKWGFRGLWLIPPFNPSLSGFNLNFKGSMNSTTACRSILLCQSITESEPEGFEWFIDGQAFSPSYDLAHPPSPPTSPVRKLERRHTGKRWKRDNLLTGEGGGQIIRQRESLVLSKSFNTLWSVLSYYRSPVCS